MLLPSDGDHVIECERRDSGRHIVYAEWMTDRGGLVGLSWWLRGFRLTAEHWLQVTDVADSATDLHGGQLTDSAPDDVSEVSWAIQFFRWFSNTDWKSSLLLGQEKQWRQYAEWELFEAVITIIANKH